MNPIIILMIIAIIGSIFGVLFKYRNEKYSKSDKGKEALVQAEEYARKTVGIDEEILIYDYSIGGNQTVVLTDKGIYFAKKGETVFHTEYRGITKCKYMDFSANKVKFNGDVVHIELRTQYGKCKIYGFANAKKIALILNDRMPSQLSR